MQPPPPPGYLPRADIDARLLAALRCEARDHELTIRVRGDCMAPLVHDGAQIEVRAARLYWPGDIVAFASREGDLRIHRLVGYRVRGGRLRAITMPDAAPQPDASIPFARILGRLRGGECAPEAVHIPFGQRWRALRRFVTAVAERLR